MSKFLLQNCRIVESQSSKIIEQQDVLIENDLISKIGKKIKPNSDTRIINLNHCFLLPGLIDAHVHATVWSLDLSLMNGTPATLMALHAQKILEAMLMRGFTTVRDAGGADYGLSEAINAELINGPRLFFSGKGITQTGGHGDFRDHNTPFIPYANYFQHEIIMPHIADGVAEVQKAAREELRKGASQIKIMASGGVSSPTDPLDSVGYSVAEIEAIVDVARSRHTYVLAHACMPEAIQRCVKCGVKSIEHGNLLNEETANLMAEKKAYLVPTLVTYASLERIGKKFAYPEDSLEKLKQIRLAGLDSIKLAKNAGVKIGFGTDLLGQCHDDQLLEFVIRNEIEAPHEILTAATITNAEILNMQGKIGCIKEDAFADLIAIENNPLENIHNLSDDNGEKIALIIKGGKLVKNNLKFQKM